MLVPSPRRLVILKVPTSTPIPQRSRRLRGEEAPSVNLAAHPDYVRCNTSLITDRMRGKSSIK